MYRQCHFLGEKDKGDVVSASVAGHADSVVVLANKAVSRNDE